MAYYKLLLLCCCSIVALRGEDVFTLDQHSVLAANVNFSAVHLDDGLYSLGEVKEDGFFSSVCARGKVVNSNNSGIMFFYLIRESNGVLMVKDNFELVFNEGNFNCKYHFYNQRAPKKNDILAVFIGSNTLRRNNMDFSPVLIGYKDETTTSKFFEGSNVFGEILKIPQLHKKMQSTVRGELSREEMTPLHNTRLNVQVIIIRSSQKNTTVLIVGIAGICIIILFALLAVIVLLLIRMSKKRSHLKANTARFSELPSVEMCGDETDDSTTTKDFGDVQYLLQKDTKRAVIHITHYHGSKGQDTMTKNEKEQHTYSLLTNEPCDSTEAATIPDHDYDEPYFEPACTEETLLKQLKTLGVPLIAKETLKLHSDDVLGRGAFGSVHRGVLYSVLEFNKLTEEEVAVKTLEDMTSEEDRVKFLQEAAIMGQFSHPNIIKILGIVISPDSCKLVIEVMSRGDLRNHLHTIKPDDLEQELAPTLLSYSRHVANGMMYLAVKSFVHRDLAARNVLVAEDGVCKIADFGLSRKLQDEDYYVSHGGKIPVKWTAPEALHYHKYSTASDVWSYGCALYEIWSLGEKPYHDLSNEKIIEKLSSGFRLSPPPGCPREVYKIMIQCWHSDPVQRPSFMDITAQLQKPDYQVLKWKEDPQVFGDTSSSSKEARVIGAALEAGFELHQDLQKTYYIT